MKITSNEILDALRAAVATSADPDGAATVQEIVSISGMGEGSVQARLRAIKAAGGLEVVRVRRESLDGRTVTVPAYRVKKAKRK